MNGNSWVGGLSGNGIRVSLIDPSFNLTAEANELNNIKRKDDQRKHHCMLLLSALTFQRYMVVSLLFTALALDRLPSAVCSCTPFLILAILHLHSKDLIHPTSPYKMRFTGRLLLLFLKYATNMRRNA